MDQFTEDGSRISFAIVCVEMDSLVGFPYGFDLEFSKWSTNRYLPLIRGAKRLAICGENALLSPHRTLKLNLMLIMS